MEYPRSQIQRSLDLDKISDVFLDGRGILNQENPLVVAVNQYGLRTAANALFGAIGIRAGVDSVTRASAGTLFV